MTNTLRAKTLKTSLLFNKETLKIDAASFKGMIAGIKTRVDIGNEAAKIAPYVVARISSDYCGDRNDTGQLNALYAALSGKTRRENKLQASLRGFACFHIAGLKFEKDTASPFGFTKTVKAAERFLSEDFKLSLDFRLFEKSGTEKTDKITLFTAKRLATVNEQLIKSFNSFDVTDTEQLAKYKLDLFEEVVKLASLFDRDILINRLLAEVAIVTSSDAEAAATCQEAQSLGLALLNKGN